jgi:hypothetical protein
VKSGADCGSPARVDDESGCQGARAATIGGLSRRGGRLYGEEKRGCESPLMSPRGGVNRQF